MKQRIGVHDILLWILLLCMMVVLFLVCFLFRGGEGEQVEISLQGKVYGIYDLSEDRIIEVGNGTITNVVEIRQGKVYMTEADCPDRLCIRQGKISRDRETIVCLPNRVVVTVRSKQKTDYDAVAN